MTDTIEKIWTGVTTLTGTLGNDAIPVVVNYDQPVAPSYSAVYGLSGNDTLNTAYLTGYGALVGGQGDDAYLIRSGAKAVVNENGHSAGDAIKFSEAFSSFEFRTTSDGHLLAKSGETSVVIADWLNPADRIESWSFGDGAHDMGQVMAKATAGAESVLGDMTATVRATIATTDAGEKNAEVAALDAADFSRDPDNVYRFFNAETGRHFFTGSAVERDAVIRNYDQFVFEGPAFKSVGDSVDAVDVFRFYNSSTGAHFYTASADEKQYVIDHYREFAYEGAVYKAHETGANGGTALFRFYNDDTHSHFYTISTAERDSVIATYPAFHYEGVAFYVDV